jgi:hypothetical protein
VYIFLVNKAARFFVSDLCILICFKSIVTVLWWRKGHITLTGAEICALLGYYAASSGNPLPTFLDNLSVPYSRVKKPKKDFLTLEYWTDRLSRNVGKGLPLDAAEASRSLQHRGGSPKSRIWLVLSVIVVILSLLSSYLRCVSRSTGITVTHFRTIRQSGFKEHWHMLDSLRHR